MFAQFVFPHLGAALPEIVMSGAAILLLLIGLGKQSSRWVYPLTLMTLLLAIVLAGYTARFGKEVSFSGLFVLDPMAVVLKMVLAATVAVVLLLSRADLIERKVASSEYYVLALFATAGMMLMISAGHFVTLYIGLELLSLSLYSLIAFNRDSPLSIEAAIKYFVLGAIASGLLLYGISMIYGATGTMEFSALASRVLQGTSERSLVLVFGLVFVVAGLAFKLGAVPFHMWVPDIYQGSYTGVTLFIASAPKLAAFAMLVRVLGVGLYGLAADWQSMLIVLAVMSMAVGNLAAIAQTSLKRLLAYSAISHMGFMLLGMASGVVGGSSALQSDAYAASMFYVLVYVLMTLGGFGLLLALGKGQGQAYEDICHLKGLNQRSPWMAAMWLVVMFSMAGVPFFVGFFAKFAVIYATVKAGYVALAVAAVVFSLIGAFYYLRIVKVMYFDAADEETATLASPLTVRLTASVLAILVALFGLYPQPIIALTQRAMAQTLLY